MLHVVYLQEKDDKHPVLIAAFLMKSDADNFMKQSNLSEFYKVKETTSKAWKSWSKIMGEI
jgi:hypothetical protein